MWRAIILVTVSVTVTSTNNCISRRSHASGDDDGHYCVCNTTYCDKAPNAIKPNNSAEYILITSSKSGLRFNVSHDIYGNVDPRDVPSAKITVDRTKTYQDIIGFGGALTDAAGFNIKRLPKNASDSILRSYFGRHGIGYSIIRVPMAGSDFSWRPYSYSMTENDTTLTDFSLQPEDYSYKIPIIKKAIRLRKGKIKLMTVPWSASPWMKTNNDWSCTGSLIPEYRQLWADYFVKYFQSYRSLGIEFWALSPQNEPYNYAYMTKFFNAMAWTAAEERDWIINYLSPTLTRTNFEHIKIFIGDENRLIFPKWAKTSFKSKRARNIVSGIAIHWYFDGFNSTDILDEMKQLFPEKQLLYTEACTGVLQKERVILGSWKRGEMYARSIIESMSHSVSAWVDWNIALDVNGGPNWIKNYVDSPIIVNATANEFYKQPMFYALGHFSKYVPPESVRIDSISEMTNGIRHIAFSTPNGAITLVIVNLNEEEKKILIEDPTKGKTRINVLGKSINTMIYW